MNTKKTAVVLFQLGGPDSLDEVQPFLFNLFMDPDIIDFPGFFFIRKLLAGFISRRRSKESMEKYKQIGGKSPIYDLTKEQASALESMLQSQNKNINVFIAMRYWKPSIETAVENIKAAGFEQAILLPLYPQFSKATSLSSYNEWKRQEKRHGLAIQSRFICCYPGHPMLIEAFVENINSAFRRFKNIPSENIDLVFSAHGIPVRYINQGDPYQMQVEETVKGIIKLGGWNSPHVLCYQSKLGPMKWLQPSLHKTIKDLAGRGRKNLLVIPAAFVTDHIETLYEIGIEEYRHALECGINQLEIMPALNSHTKFIQCLAELVINRIDTGELPNTCRRIQSGQKNTSKKSLCPFNFSKL
ncbi:MAG: ferrochelatase [Bacteroidetes bacterium]|nr:ferrochelatase [Bacteroidota bacterium]